MTVVDVFRNQHQRLITSVKLDATIQLSCQSAQTLQPTMEAWLKLRPGRHHYLDTAQGRHRLYETGKDNLTVQTVVETLNEFSPEAGVDIGMNVHTHNNLRTGKLPEGMLDAVGNIRGEAHLCLYLDIGSTGGLL